MPPAQGGILLVTDSLTRYHHAMDHHARDPHRVGILRRPEFTITLLRNSKGYPRILVKLSNSHKI